MKGQFLPDKTGLPLSEYFKTSSVLDDLPCLIFSIQKASTGFSFSFINAAIEEELEIKQDQLLKDMQTLLNLLSNIDKDSFLQSLEDSAKNLSHWKWEGCFHLSSGKKKWLQGLAKPTKKAKDTTIFNGIFTDITTYKHTDEMLLETNKLTKSGAWELDLVKKTIYWSEEVYRIHELDPTIKPNLETALEFYPDESRPIITRDIEKAIEDGIPWDNEIPFITAKGNNIWVRTSGKAVFENDKAVKLYGAFQDITERKLAEEILRVIFEYSTDPHLVFGTEGIIDCNQAAVNILHCKDKADLLAQHPATFSPEYQPDGQRSIDKSVEMDKLAYENGYHQFEWLHKRMDGEAFSVTVTINPVWINKKRVLLVVWHDITAQKRAQEELIKAKELAEQAAIAKSQFLSAMSHEIRTPMNAVIGFTNLLLQKNPTEEQLEYLKVLKFSGENLLVIINDILDFSKIEEGKIEFELIDFSVEDLANNIRLALLQRANDKGLQLKLMIDKDLSDAVIGDPVRLGQILTNLLTNAIKFTPKGKVTVSAILSSRDDINTVINFEISDTGIGIAEDKLTAVFERFTQASEDTTRKYGGTGLGLTITKRLIELQGGHIYLESKLGVGSCFKFSLSFKNGNSNLVKNNKQAPVKILSSLKGITVLMAEDNEINIMLVKQFMKLWDVECDVVHNGLMAVQQVQVKDYDMIFMDLQMPEMDGYQAAAAIRELGEEKFKTLPIIALTASAMPDIKYKVFQIGMNDYISKPFNPEEMYHKIETYGRKTRLED